MEFYFTDHSRNNIGALPKEGYIDCDIGKDNNFAVNIPLKFYSARSSMQGGYIYSPGTEIGGLMNNMSVKTSSGEVSFTGHSFRGMLNYRYIEPPAGSDYLMVSGDLIECVSSLCDGLLDGLFRVVGGNTGISVNNQRINRYDSVLDAVETLLSPKGYRIELEAVEDQNYDIVNFHIDIRIVPVVDHSDRIENSNDGLINFDISKKEYLPYTHLLALGKGDLKDRLVIHYKINANGSITEISSFPKSGMVRIYKFDYPNAESREVLETESQKKAKEILSSDKQSITISDNMGVWLGDIVGGREYTTGTYIKEPIKQIIYKFSNGEENFSYKIGEK